MSEESRPLRSELRELYYGHTQRALRFQGVLLLLDFVIVAFAIFMVIRAMNAARRKEEAPPAEPTTKKCPRCLSEIPIAATRCAYCTTDV